MRIVVAAACLIVTARVAHAQRWQDGTATASCVGTTAEWSSKIELADVDGDGLPDILVANGGDYATPGTPEPTRVWKNLGNWGVAGAHCSEISAQAVGGFVGLSRMIKVADVNGDGKPDILTGGAYHTQLRLFLRDGAGWTDATAQLPQQMTSIGDAEFGDVDGDGDLDIVLADWGDADPGDANYAGGRTRLYLNDGHGNFTEATATQMPDILVAWSWDIEFVDVDNDFDLDILVSCKLCDTSYLFTNDGTGHFTNAPDALPHFTNNYEFEPMDIDGDGYLDLATINDGTGGRDHLFHNRGDGTYADETLDRLAADSNPAADDNAAVWLDVDNDGDADLLVASLSGPDRLSLNDGTGHFTLAPNATPDDTPGSLGIAVGDLDGDGRLDIVQSQGEVAFPDKVQLATTMVAIDTQPPVIAVEQVHHLGDTVHARVHDH
ncbi:MAG TPA: VCBS repeat-containing protein, partial [Kofleriaceae bacterium]|nr:VCBS repeat-containing protein [Kofleriaceae bacterium]